jgi:hypothetical protein
MRASVLMLCCAAALAPAWAGHEVSYYPSFYPQEIRIEPLDPERAGQEFTSKTDPLHAYIGTAPRFSGEAPGYLKSVESLRSFITLAVDPRRVPSRDRRCRAMQEAANAFVPQPDVVPHRYPVTPYHADYLGHVDLATAGARAEPASDASTALDAPSVRFDESIVADVLLRAGIGFNTWPAPAFAKQGWFQAYHLLRAAMTDDGEKKRADDLYQRLTNHDFADKTDQLRLERSLIDALTANCEMAVVGYRLRRESYNDDFSNGIENLLIDSQSGFNTPVFVRTVKLKDFPWNGWLRFGIDTPPAAAWNPVAGFTDAAGRLVWSAVGDNAFLPVPYNSRWVPNRVEIRPEDGPQARQSLRVPADAVALERATGRLVPVGANAAATGRVTYRVLASAFHDGTAMETADLLYPYALAFRWGEPGGAVFDPDIATMTQAIRDRFRGARVVRVEESKLVLADLTFIYHSPIVEVYLENPSAGTTENGVIAPPWSSLPWHVLALMEAAVERGIAAFSKPEAARRGVPWLDLARDPAQLAQLRALVTELAHMSYRPVALEHLVTAQAAKARWEALDAFASEKGHLLVTNGPYRLRGWSPEATTLDVVRDFTYPVGLGTFNPYSYPPRAIITTVARVWSGIHIAADVEMAVKAQRDHKIVRSALTRETLRDTLPIQAEARYVLVGEDGKVAAAGAARRQADGHFLAPLPEGLPPGQYTAAAAVFLDGNAFAPDIGRVTFRKD